MTRRPDLFCRNPLPTMARLLRRVWQAETSSYAVLLTMATQGFVVLLNVMTGVITARLLGPEGRGVFAAVTLWPQFLAGMMNLGIPAALIYFIRNEPSERGAVVTAGLAITVLICLVGTAVGWLVVPLTMCHYGQRSIDLAIFCTLWTTPYLLTMVVRQVLVAYRRFTAFNVSSYLPPVLYMMALLAAYVFGTLTPATAADALMLPSILVLSWLVIVLRRDWHGEHRRLLHWTSQLAAYAAKAAPADIVSNALLYIDRVALVLLIPAGELGLYVVAFSLSRLMFILQTAVTSVVFPSMVGRSVSEAKELHDHALRLVLYAVIGATAIVVVLGPFLLSAVYGPEFGPAAMLLRILVIEAGLTCIGQVMCQLFLSLHRPGYTSIAQLVSLMVACAGLAGFVPAFGAYGAAWALLTAAAARGAILLIGIPWQLHLALPRLRPTRADTLYLRSRLV